MPGMRNQSAGEILRTLAMFCFAGKTGFPRGDEGGSRLKGITEAIAVVLDDPDMKVKRAALEAFKNA